MDKKIIFSVAGSGKTSYIVKSLDERRRSLVVTYTDANRENLRRKIVERFGYFPSNVYLYTYFKFLHGFCYRPYLRSEKNTRGITFEIPPQRQRFTLDNEKRYITPGRWLYANRLAKFLEQTGTTPLVVERVEKYFDVMYVDEVQDFAGHDFNHLISLSQARVPCLFVGDFYQHTYDTSRDGAVNSSLHDDYVKYQAKFKAANISIDLDSLSKSYRCSKSVCDFITEKIGIPIESHFERVTDVRFTEDAREVQAIFERAETVKLFLSGHYKYGCFSQNWGASKGLDNYHDVCVVLNPANVKAWKTGSFVDIKTATRNKLYVACSRAKGSLTFVPEKLLNKHQMV